MNSKMTSCKACGKEIGKGAKICPHCGKDQRNFFMKHKIISAIGIIVVLSIAGALGSNGNKGAGNSDVKEASSVTSKSTTITTTSKTEAKPAVKQRQLQGKATDLGAGTFTAGKDIPEGLYDVTPIDGQGNFTITNASSMDLDVNEILGTSEGMGVSKVRVKLVKDEQIQLQSINKTHFEPVVAQFVTDHKALSLYSGRFVVGEDIGKGRYTAAAASGGGNFVVYDDGTPKINEILGDNGVKQVTVDLNDGDIVTIASLNQVNFTPIN